MNSHFRQVALIGKYHAAAARRRMAASTRAALEDIAQFLASQGCEVVVERDTAANCRHHRLPTLDVPAIGAQCDLGLVVGGDGTMLGIGRQLARYGVPLIGINQGRLGFITDIPLDNYRDALTPMLAGEYEEDQRSLMHAQVMRDGALRVRRAGHERRGGQPRRHLRHGGTAGRGRTAISWPTSAPTA